MPKIKESEGNFVVWTARDGTIAMALPGAKRRSQYKNGCSGWHRWDEKQLAISDWGKSVIRGAVVNRLNLTRVLRQQIEPKFDTIIERLGVLDCRLTEIERARER